MVQLLLDLQMSPPQDGGPTVAMGFPDDEIKQIGDKIASLTPQQAKALTCYLEALGLEDVSVRS